MSVIDELTAACVSPLPLEDRAQYALALVDEAFTVLYGADISRWLPKQQAAYQRAMDEVRAALAAEQTSRSGVA